MIRKNFILRSLCAGILLLYVAFLEAATPYCGTPLTNGDKVVYLTCTMTDVNTYKILIVGEGLDGLSGSYVHVNGRGEYYLNGDHMEVAEDGTSISCVIESTTPPQFYTPLYVLMPLEVNFGTPSDIDWSGCTHDIEPPVMGTVALYGEPTYNSAQLEVLGATDDLAVVAYHVVDAVNGYDMVIVPEGDLLTLSGLQPETVYNFTVSAMDGSNQESSNTASISLKTEAFVYHEYVMMHLNDDNFYNSEACIVVTLQKERGNSFSVTVSPYRAETVIDYVSVNVVNQNKSANIGEAGSGVSVSGEKIIFTDLASLTDLSLEIFWHTPSLGEGGSWLVSISSVLESELYRGDPCCDQIDIASGLSIRYKVETYNDTTHFMVIPVNKTSLTDVQLMLKDGSTYPMSLSGGAWRYEFPNTEELSYCFQLNGTEQTEYLVHLPFDNQECYVNADIDYTEDWAGANLILENGTFSNNHSDAYLMNLMLVGATAFENNGSITILGNLIIGSDTEAATQWLKTGKVKVYGKVLACIDFPEGGLWYPNMIPYDFIDIYADQWGTIPVCNNNGSVSGEQIKYVAAQYGIIGNNQIPSWSWVNGDLIAGENYFLAVAENNERLYFELPKTEAKTRFSQQEEVVNIEMGSDLFTGWNFIANPLQQDAVLNTENAFFYQYNPQSDNYSVLPINDHVTVSPFYSFIVKANNETNETTTASFHVIDESGNNQRTKQDGAQDIVLEVDGYKTYLRFDKDATINYDVLMDAPYLFGGDLSIGLYTKNDIYYAINTLPLGENSVSLGYVLSEGEHILSWNMENQASINTCYLYDTFTEQWIDMQEEAYYVFDNEENGKVDGRFLLVLDYSNSTSGEVTTSFIDQIDSEASFRLIGNVLEINVQQPTLCKVVDVMGRIVAYGRITSNVSVQLGGKGMYVLCLGEEKHKIVVL